MNEATLKNILVFLTRVQCTGEECFAWVETRTVVQNALAALQAQAPTEPSTP